MSDDDRPLVSVIIPLFNAQKYIEDCVKCLRSQTLHLFEAILVDDYSTDASFKVLERATGDDERFTLASNNGPKGVSSARNKGIELARGKYLYFLDIDDQLQAHALGQIIGVNPGHGLVCTTYFKKYDHKPPEEFNHEIRENCELSSQEIFEYVKKYVRKPYKYTLFVHCWNKFYRTNIVKENGLQFNNDLHQLEDVNFNFQYLQHVADVRFLKNGGYVHCVRSDDESASKFSGFGIDPVIKCQLALKSVQDCLDTKFKLPKEKSEKLIDHLFSTITIMFFYRMIKRLTERPDLSTLKQIRMWIGSRELKKAIDNYEVQKGESRLLKTLIKISPMLSIVHAICRTKIRS